MAAKTTPKTLALVLANLTVFALQEQRESPAACRDFCHRLDAFLDDLASLDAFGTEGQCDPRGDQRG